MCGEPRTWGHIKCHCAWVVNYYLGHHSNCDCSFAYIEDLFKDTKIFFVSKVSKWGSTENKWLAPSCSPVLHVLQLLEGCLILITFLFELHGKLLQEPSIFINGGQQLERVTLRENRLSVNIYRLNGATRLLKAPSKTLHFLVVQDTYSRGFCSRDRHH